MVTASANRSITRQWVRVSSRHPCPICQKPDWCLISQDGKAVICARTESSKPSGTKGAGWFHDLDRATTPPPATHANTTRTPKASSDVLDTVYSALLRHLPLSANHADNLCHRGLTDSEIRELGYRTLPGYGRREIVAPLQIMALSGVPGFYRESGKWRLAGALVSLFQ